jgi:hypothetical protein
MLGSNPLATAISHLSEAPLNPKKEPHRLFPSRIRMAPGLRVFRALFNAS